MSNYSNEHESLYKSPEEQRNQIQPILLEWRNLEYSTEASSGDLKILNNVSGFSNPGEILAIMGQSGCGKTSLLSILAQNLSNVKNYSLSGQVTYNGADVSSINSSLFVRYIFQDSALFDFLTAYETLKFESSLKLEASEEYIEKHIENLLQQFELTNVQHTIIGNNLFSGLSGGEKKRLSIAVELVTNPSLLILDEPTSGLDSRIAASVIEILNKVKKMGVNVVFSIHQPSSFMFERFDRLILMQHGQFLYQGKASSSVSYFNELGYSIENTLNPPECFMKIIALVDKNSLSEEELKKQTKLCEAYQNNESLMWNDRLCILNEEYALHYRAYRAGVYKSFKLLLWRNLLALRRNTILLKLKFIQPIIYGIILDLLYYDIGNDNKGVENRNGIFMFFIVSNFCVTGMYYAVITAHERSLSAKEIYDRKYPLISYYLSKFVIDIPLFAVSVLLITLTMYFVIGLNLETWTKIFIFYGIGFTYHIAGMTFGCLVGNIAGSPSIAFKITPVCFLSFMIFSGMFTSYNATPEIMKPIKYITPIYYGRMALLKNEFDDLDIDSDVIPKPEDRYEYDREIYLNEIYLICISVSYFILSYIIGLIRINSEKKINFK